MSKAISSGSILALTKYGYAGPSSRYRFYNYKECFESDGYRVTIKPFFDDRYFDTTRSIEKLFHVFVAFILRIGLLLKLLLWPKRFDLILIEYELIPYFPAIFEWFLVKRGYKYIVDYDDPLFHRYDMHKNFFIRFFFKKKIAKVMKYAQAVIVCNDYLMQYAKNYNSRLVTLPTVVKYLDEYISAASKEKRSFKEEKVVNIGWIGSKTTSKFVVDILPAIEKASKELSVKFTLIGFDAELLTATDKDHPFIEVIPWSEEVEIIEIAKMDIGIMPLNDNAWTRGKCGFKLIQYMSCAKPVIASDVGVNHLIVGYQNGFLVKSLEDWYNAFVTLVQDSDLRDQMGEKGLSQVKERYNYVSNCKKYIDLIESVIGTDG